ncbi:ribokinase [Rhizobium azooxidifex]|uniref:Ribokinase n=1 Tax=Mycoplana azooxidifex TaxID=1636188 RepID=A0A7W6DC94_9HYPH|nr:ribokinase [Mycoplana azooxidifex]MBB3979899.1 ribokinase [Mycoplana azooxidifex]
MPDQREILVFGSHVYGSYIHCERIPRPGETVAGTGYHPMVLDDGGKGSNQAMCAARLTGRTSLVSAIGTDRGGEEGLALLSAEGCDVSRVLRSPDLPTGVSLAAIDRTGMSIIITDPGANLMLTADAAKSNEAAFGRHMFCLLQFEGPKDGALEAARLARKHGARSMLTPGPMVALNKDELEGLDIIIPNETEAAELLGVEEISDYRAAAREICARWDVTNTIITCGSRGAVAWWENALIEVSAFKVNAKNTIGAGDAFAASCALALCRGLDISQALRFAAAVAAISVSAAGAPWASYPSLNNVHDFLAHVGETIRLPPISDL